MGRIRLLMHPDDYGCAVSRKSTVAPTGMLSLRLKTGAWQVVDSFASFTKD